MKKRKKNPTDLSLIDDPRKKQERILDMLGMMKHRELVIACVSRGLGFDQVIKLDHNGLGSFFVNNFDNTENPSLVIEYDNWLDRELEKRGHKEGDAMRSPLLRLGYVGKGDLSDAPTKIVEPGANNKKIPEEAKVDKVKREKDESTGVVSGTKKNLTYKLAKSGVELSEVVSKVKEAFPDAQDKSIKIWYKRAKKEQEDGND